MVPLKAAKETGKARPIAPQQKPARRKPSRATASKHGVLKDPKQVFSDEEWYDMVATAAYFRAESRGFEGGAAEDDWYQAEAELRERMASAEDTFDMESRESPETDRNDIQRKGA